MESLATYTVSFNNVFGNEYEKEIISLSDAKIALENISLQDICKALYENVPSVAGGRADAYLDLTNGELFVFAAIGNTDLQETGHLFPLKSIKYNDLNYSEEDLNLEYCGLTVAEATIDCMVEYARERNEYEDLEEKLIEFYAQSFENIDIEIEGIETTDSHGTWVYFWNLGNNEIRGKCGNIWGDIVDYADSLEEAKELLEERNAQ